MLQLPKYIHRDFFMVRISREIQKAKRTKMGNLFINPNNAFMMYNQQHGQVIGWGANALRELPEIQPLDILFFHHSIEGSLDDRGGDKRQWDENNKAILMQDEEWIVYLVHMAEAYGIMKPNGAVCMMPNWLLCKPHIQAQPINVEVDEQGRRLVKSGSIYLFADKFELSDGQKMEKIEKIKTDIQSLSRSGVGEEEGYSKEVNRRRDAVKVKITEMMKEMQDLTNELSKKQFKPYHVVAAPKWFKSDIGIDNLKDYLFYYFCLGGAGAPDIEIGNKIFYRVPIRQLYYIEKIT